MGRPGLAASWVLALLGGIVAPRALGSPAEDPPRLMDVDKAAADVVARHTAHDLPRFEERIEVRTYQEALEALLGGTELGCGATERGAPTRYDMNPYRGSPIPVHADFLGAAKLLYSVVKGLSSSKEQRFFLYAVRRDAEPGTALPETIELLVREGRLRDADLQSPGGARFELVAGFRERAQALTALRRLERGFQGLARARPYEAPPPWFATPCPVPGFR